MNFFQQFYWLAEEALSGLLFAWPATLFLVLLIAAAMAHAVRKRRFTLRNSSWALLPAVVPLVILVWGVAFEKSGIGMTWQAQAIYVLFFSQFVVSAIAIWRAGNVRILAFALSAFIAHYSFWSGFVAGMSVTDDWL